MSEELREAFEEFEEKYFKLVSYARTSAICPESRFNRDAQLEEFYPDETMALKSESGDWQHGFHSGCLASMRYVMTALYPEVMPGESSDTGEPWVYGGLEDAKEEFPMLDT